jgi:glycogen debranching enzyme
MIRFDRDICSDLDAALRREWLETNGLGGFASSTFMGLHTRRYHGLLTAATTSPIGRMLLLAKLEEVLILDGLHYELSMNPYPGVIHPQGYHYLSQFRLDLFPIFLYEVCGMALKKWHPNMDDDGLLLAGGEGVQLTWMDAKVGGWVVTPRRGKPVEVQALWYNALCLMAHLAASSAMMGQRNIMMRDMRT